MEDRARVHLEQRDSLEALERGDIPWTLNPFSELSTDPGQWGHSMVNNGENIVACLNAAGVRSVVEIGAYAGALTRFLLDWAATADATVCAVDPSPQDELVALDASSDALTLHRATSVEALEVLKPPDCYIIDGDHNYYTVSEELRLIAERAGDVELPLLLFHDVCWPHARRDDYYAPEQIPEAFRQPTIEGGGLFPGISEPQRGGLPYQWPAAREGGPRNGVLTAIEDFVGARGDLRLAIVPAFFGLGVVWDTRLPYDAALARFLDPLDRNPVIARLEFNRTLHLVAMYQQLIEVHILNERLARQRTLLARLLRSRAFAFAERLSNLRARAGIEPGDPGVSRAEIERALGESR